MIFERTVRRMLQPFIQKEMQAQLATVNHSTLTQSDYQSRFGGKTQPENYAAYMQAYSEEVYVYACVYLIANTIAGLPLKAYRKKANGDLEEVKGHVVLDLLASPNELYSGYTLKESLASNLELTGNAYIFLQDLVGAKPRKIYSLNSAKVKIIPSEEEGKLVAGYEYTIGSKKITIPLAQIIHSKYYNPADDFYGQSSISAGRWAVETVENARIQNNKIFVNGMKIDGSLTTDQQLSDESYSRLLSQLAQEHQGSEKSHKLMLLEAGLKYQEMGISPRDLDFVNGMKLNREEICAIFSVPPVMVGIQDQSTYNNLKEAQTIFWRECITPKLKKLDYVLTYLAQLFDKTLIIQHDLSGVEALKADLTTMIDITQKLWAMGMPLNQIIRDLKLPLSTVDGGEAGYIPFSVVQVGEPVPPADGSDSSSQGKSGSPAQKISATHPAGGAVPARKLKIWSPEQKDAIWKKFVAYQGMIERAFKADLRDYFQKLTGEMASKAGEFKAINVQHLGGSMYLLYGVEKESGITKSLSLESVLFDERGAIADLQKIELQYTSEALQKQADQDLKLLGIDISFDLSNPATQAFLQKNALEKCTTIIQNYKAAVSESLIAGITSGESVPNLIDRILAEGQKMDEFGAERIARTESVMAANQGSMASYAQAGVKKKGWLSAMDERARDSHKEADRKYQDGIPIDQEFEVGEARGMAPANMDLPEESINCRCSLIPIIDEIPSATSAEGEQNQPAPSLSTKEELANQLMSDYSLREVSYKGASDELAHELDSKLREMLGAFPSSKLKSFTIGKMPHPRYMGYVQYQKNMVLSDVKLADAAKARQIMEHSSEIGWHPPIGDKKYLESLVTHEYAHTLWFSLFSRTSDIEAFTHKFRVWSRKRGAAKAVITKLFNDKVSALSARSLPLAEYNAEVSKLREWAKVEYSKVYTVSQYSLHDTDELFAESFTYWYHSEDKDLPEFMKEFGKMVSDQFGVKKG